MVFLITPELANNLQSEKNFSQRNSETLKEVADLLSSMVGQGN